MQVGSLVKRIEFGYIGVATQQGISTCDLWLIHFSEGVVQDRWCMERELEVICR